MVSVLVIEDNEQKYLAVRSVIDSVAICSVKWSRTMLTSYKLLSDQSWDVIVLDMTFEDADGFFRAVSKKPLAGIEILQFIDAKGIDTKAVVVTQHDFFPIPGRATSMDLGELRGLLTDAFPSTYVGLVRARLGDPSVLWIDELVSLLRKILDV